MKSKKIEGKNRKDSGMEIKENKVSLKHTQGQPDKASCIHIPIN